MQQPTNNEQRGKAATEWMNEWVSEWVSEWTSDWVTDRVSEWVSEWVSERVTDWLSDWPSEWVEWMNEWIVWDFAGKRQMLESEAWSVASKGIKLSDQSHNERKTFKVAYCAYWRIN